MNFIIVEGKHADLESIHDDFCNDYLWSNELSNKEIRKKYDLTVREFSEMIKKVKAEHGLVRRPRKKIRGKYYFKHRNSWSIQKWKNGKMVHFGTVPTTEIAETVVDLCIEADWDIPVCKEIVQNWREHIGS